MGLWGEFNPTVSQRTPVVQTKPSLWTGRGGLSPLLSSCKMQQEFGGSRAAATNPERERERERERDF
jgi:hypothetical protein